jgi:hypothetical protein
MQADAADGNPAPPIGLAGIQTQHSTNVKSEIYLQVEGTQRVQATKQRINLMLMGPNQQDC